MWNEYIWAYKFFRHFLLIQVFKIARSWARSQESSRIFEALDSCLDFTKLGKLYEGSLGKGRGRCCSDYANKPGINSQEAKQNELLSKKQAFHRNDV